MGNKQYADNGPSIIHVMCQSASLPDHAPDSVGQQPQSRDGGLGIDFAFSQFIRPQWCLLFESFNSTVRLLLLLLVEGGSEFIHGHTE